MYSANVQANMPQSLPFICCGIFCGQKKFRYFNSNAWRSLPKKKETGSNENLPFA